MVGKVLNITDWISPDQLGTQIAKNWTQWNVLRQDWLTEKIDLRKYIFATSTKQTANMTQPWKNTTTIPKICQIRDNLTANYELNLFPRANSSITWEAADEDSNNAPKRDSILNYMRWANGQDRFKNEMRKCILDYVDYGNAFGTIEWVDQRVTLHDGRQQVGYVGPSLRRISPLIS
jgi:hypothetical protein